MKFSKAAVLILGFCLGGNGWAESGDRFRDAEDGAFDLSTHLLEHNGVLPVPIIITEPALGYGLGAAAVYFDEPLTSKNRNRGATDRLAPPNISALAGFKTEHESWGVGGALFRSWDGDRYRYLGGLGKVELNLDYCGLLGRPRSFQLEGVGLSSNCRPASGTAIGS